MCAKNNIREQLAESVFLFLFFSMIGWLYEVGLAFLYGYGFINRGFLFGPYLPLYGFGALLLIACLHRVMKASLRVGPVSVTPLVVFLLIVLITTALEYVVGVGLEALFHQRFWDYSTYKYQLHGRICLSASIRFGIGGMVFLYVLAPMFRKLIQRIPAHIRNRTACVVVILFLLDFIFTLLFASANGFDPTLAQPR